MALFGDEAATYARRPSDREALDGGFRAVNVSDGMWTLYMVLFGNFDHSFLTIQNEGGVVFLMFTVIGSFVFSNLLIAMFDSTYREIEMEARGIWVRVWMSVAFPACITC